MIDMDLLATDIALPFPNCYWVKPGRFMAGEYPGSPLLREAQEKVSGLLITGVDTFIDLTLDDPLEPYLPILKAAAARQRRPYRYEKLGFRDFSTPSSRHMKVILDLIDDAMLSGHIVYVHCWGGIGRTGTVVGCYLARHGVTGPAALKEISRLRLLVPSARPSPETDEQRRMVIGWPAGQ